LLRHARTFEVWALLTTEWNTVDSPRQIDCDAHDSVIICTLDQPGDPSDAVDQGSTFLDQVTPPSLVRMISVRCTPSVLPEAATAATGRSEGTNATAMHVVAVKHCNCDQDPWTFLNPTSSAVSPPSTGLIMTLCFDHVAPPSTVLSIHWVQP
jgi:hypothetical protein